MVVGCYCCYCLGIVESWGQAWVRIVIAAPGRTGVYHDASNDIGASFSLPWWKVNPCILCLLLKPISQVSYAEVGMKVCAVSHTAHILPINTILAPEWKEKMRMYNHQTFPDSCDWLSFCVDNSLLSDRLTCHLMDHIVSWEPEGHYQ